MEATQKMQELFDDLHLTSKQRKELMTDLENIPRSLATNPSISAFEVSFKLISEPQIKYLLLMFKLDDVEKDLLLIIECTELTKKQFDAFRLGQ